MSGYQEIATVKCNIQSCLYFIQRMQVSHTHMHTHIHALTAEPTVGM